MVRTTALRSTVPGVARTVGAVDGTEAQVRRQPYVQDRAQDARVLKRIAIGDVVLAVRNDALSVGVPGPAIAGNCRKVPGSLPAHVDGPQDARATPRSAAAQASYCHRNSFVLCRSSPPVCTSCLTSALPSAGRHRRSSSLLLRGLHALPAAWLSALRGGAWISSPFQPVKDEGARVVPAFLGGGKQRWGPCHFSPYAF